MHHGCKLMLPRFKLSEVELITGLLTRQGTAIGEASASQSEAMAKRRAAFASGCPLGERGVSGGPNRAP